MNYSKVKEFRQKNILKEREKLAKNARKMYISGLSLREIGKALGISHTWVWMIMGGDVHNSNE